MVLIGMGVACEEFRLVDNQCDDDPWDESMRYAFRPDLRQQEQAENLRMTRVALPALGGMLRPHLKESIVRIAPTMPPATADARSFTVGKITRLELLQAR